MTLIVAIVLMIACWLVSLRLNDVSIVDILWAPSFAIVAWVCAASASHNGVRRWIVLTLILIWAIRLGSHLYRRWRGLGHEDYRYAEIRRARGPNFPLTSLFWVFGPQALLVWIVSWPLQAAVTSPLALGWMDLPGTVLGAVGIAIEAVADAQLRRFRSLAENRGKVLRTGLWAWSRHPNYFGDFTLWWGIYLLAVAGGAPWWTVVGPLVMSVLLIRVSGVGLLEQTIADRRPAYRQYIQDTSSFIPWPPRGRKRITEAE
jgi:steroid 5-alpha reductase family enzyme